MLYLLLPSPSKSPVPILDLAYVCHYHVNLLHGDLQDVTKFSLFFIKMWNELVTLTISKNKTVYRLHKKQRPILGIFQIFSSRVISVVSLSELATF